MNADKRDIVPLLLIPALAVAALPLVSSPSSWVTLTVAGLAMGLMIFVMASGLTLTFGLMDVLNFGHGAFIAVGAFVAASVMLALGPWMAANSFWLNMAAVGPAVLAAVMVSGALGFVFERVIVRPVYGQHLKQILVTTGGLIVAEQLLKVVWGPDQITLSRPTARRGAFVVGSALAGLGGAMWGLYQETVTAAIGAQVAVLVFIVIIIGGLGSIGGCFIGALLVGLTANYIGFLAPKVALGSNILLMALILLWRPQGLYPVAKR